MTQIFTRGKIFEKLRPNHYFFKCSMCVGFWVGIILWLLKDFSGLYQFSNNFTTGILLGFLSSGTSYALCTIFSDKGFNIVTRT